MNLISKLLCQKTDYKKIDAYILDNIINVIEEYPPQKGWPTTEIIEDFFTRCVFGHEDQKLNEEIDLFNSWKRLCDSIFNHEIDEVNLREDGNLYLNSFTYLLMRRESRRILFSDEKEDSSAVKVSLAVKSLALSFAALREGYRAIPFNLRSFLYIRKK